MRQILYASFMVCAKLIQGEPGHIVWVGLLAGTLDCGVLHGAHRDLGTQCAGRICPLGFGVGFEEPLMSVRLGAGYSGDLAFTLSTRRVRARADLCG